MYVRKTIDEFRIEGNFGQGWEEVTCEETRAAGRVQLRCYRENDPEHAYRLTVARVPKVVA